MGKSVQTSKGYLGGLYNEKKIKVGYFSMQFMIRWRLLVMMMLETFSERQMEHILRRLESMEVTVIVVREQSPKDR